MLEHDKARGLPDDAAQTVGRLALLVGLRHLVVATPLHIEPHQRIDDQQHHPAEHQQRVGRAKEGGQPAPQVPRQYVDQCQEAEHRVEQRDAGEITNWAEMAHTLLSWRIVHIHRLRHQLRAVPGGQHHQQQLGLVARSEPSEATQPLERIEPVARLRVGQPLACLYPEPEVGELVGKGAALRPLRALQPPGPHDEGLRVLQMGLQ